MPAVEPIVISSAVEGVVDEAVVKRLIVEAGGAIGPIMERGENPFSDKESMATTMRLAITPGSSWLI